MLIFGNFIHFCLLIANMWQLRICWINGDSQIYPQCSELQNLTYWPLHTTGHIHLNVQRHLKLCMLRTQLHISPLQTMLPPARHSLLLLLAAVLFVFPSSQPSQKFGLHPRILPFPYLTSLDLEKWLGHRRNSGVCWMNLVVCRVLPCFVRLLIESF